MGWVGLIGIVLLSIAMTSLLSMFHRSHREQVACIEVLAAIAATLQPPDIRDHCLRVVAISENLAQELKLPKGRIAHVRIAALLHEVGWTDGHLPTESAIIKLADHFDAITHDCSRSITLDEAIEEIRREAGMRFPPAVVKALMTLALRMSSYQWTTESHNFGKGGDEIIKLRNRPA